MAKKINANKHCTVNMYKKRNTNTKTVEIQIKNLDRKYVQEKKYKNKGCRNTNKKP